jgi:3-keto-disaccharide hydrolase
MPNRILLALALLTLPLMAVERKFDFSEVREDQSPPGFRSTVTGQGKPGDWRVIMDEVPSLLPALTPGARGVAKKAVLAQLAQDATDEHFPLLIYEGETMDDFTLTTRFKTVKGVMEQMAGIAFRIQNETNYYVVRASSLGNTFRFYKVLNGERGPLVGPEVPIPSGVWHELTVECKGIRIRCLLDGKELINVEDKRNPFTSGKVGFWTKSDSVTYFADTRIVYTPHEAPAQVLVREVLKKYPRLLGLQVYVLGDDPKTSRLLASNNTNEVGRAGGRVEPDVIAQGTTYYGKEKDSVSVVMPLRDRNGDPMAAVRLIMKTFAGQTEQNAYARALPIIREMQGRVNSLQDLVK